MQKDKNTKKIFKLVQMLLYDFCTKDELIKKLDIKSATLSRYLTIIKSGGFNLIKSDKKYKIEYYKKKINYSEIDTSLIAHILNLSDNTLPKNKVYKLENLISDFMYLSDEDTMKKTANKLDLFQEITIGNKNKSKIEKFEQAKNRKFNLIVRLKKNVKEYKFRPIEIKWNKDKGYFIFEDLKQNIIRETYMDDVSYIAFYFNNSFFKSKTDVIFELYGRLARAYVLKDNEMLLDKFDDKIVVLNQFSDKEKLFKRLMRYDALCKIVYPQRVQEDFIKNVEKSLDNILILTHN